MFQSLGEYEMAKEYLIKALVIRKEIGDRKGEALCYGNLGTLFLSLCKYAKADEYLRKALAIREEIGDREGEGADYGNLGTVLQSIGYYEKAREYHEKALAISSDICHKKGEAETYLNLGTDFQFLGEFLKAEDCYKKGLAIGEETGDVEIEFRSFCKLAHIKLLEGKSQEAWLYLDQVFRSAKFCVVFSKTMTNLRYLFQMHMGFLTGHSVHCFLLPEVLKKLYLFQSLGGPEPLQI